MGGTRVRPGLAMALTAVLLAGCDQSPDANSTATSTADATAAVPTQAAATATADATAAAAPTSAFPDAPSEQAALVCTPEAQEDIEELIGVEPTQVGPLQYANHVSNCRYAYSDGAFTLTVHDLPNDLTTTQAYDALAAQRGKVDTIDLPDADAFSTSDGSVVLRKDTKVMLVDVAQLPATFGSPPAARADAARLIMKAVLGCWTETS